MPIPIEPKTGDRVMITKTKENYFNEGDTATLVSYEGDSWLAVFDSVDWADFHGGESDKHFYIQKGFSEFKVIT